MKKMPDIKKMFMKESAKPRQPWREQLSVMTEWAARHNARVEKLRELTDGSR